MNTMVYTSEFGSFSIKMHDDRAPVTCKYFTDLVSSGALDDSCVFRIVADKNHQPDEPCPINIVQIGPVQSFSGDRHASVHEDTNQTGLSHCKWTVSAARFDLGELYGSFFICMRDEPELDYGGGRQPDGQGFAAFGQIVTGFETIKQIFNRAESDEMLKQGIPIYDVSLGNESSNTESGS